MADTPKRIKRLLREQAGRAHEEELRRALVPVAEAFRRWERGELGSAELSDIIHRFHQGPARELFARYNNPYMNLAVAYAIHGRRPRPSDDSSRVARSSRHCARLLRESAGDVMRGLDRGNGPR